MEIKEQNILFKFNIVFFQLSKQHFLNLNASMVLGVKSISPQNSERV